MSNLCSAKFYTRFYTRSDLAFSMRRIQGRIQPVYTMSGTGGKSDIEDVVLDFDFLTNTGSEIFNGLRKSGS